MRRKALLSIILSAAMILGSVSPAFAAGQIPSDEVAISTEVSEPESQDEDLIEDDNTENSEQESDDAQEKAEEEIGTETESEEDGIEEETPDEESKPEIDTTDSTEEEEEKPETLVGAEREPVSVGENVTARYNSETMTLTLYSQGGTLSSDWANMLGFGYWDVVKVITISSDSDVMYLPEDCSKLFFRFINLESLNLSKADTSNVTDMSEMFYYSTRLKTLDISGFNTSNVTDMSYMFYKCSVKTLDVSGFDTSNVTNMSYMFSGTGLQGYPLDVSGFDTSNVTDMSYMFSGSGWSWIFGVSVFDTSNVTDMSNMFAGCKRLNNLDVSGFDTSNVTNMSGMFYNCSNLSTLNLSGFNTSNVTDMSQMFYGCASQQALDVNGFDTSNVANMSGMFYDCSSLQSLDVSVFDTSNVTDMSNMFAGCKRLNNLDVSGFDTSNVTNMSGMFNHCGSLQTLDISEFDTSNVADMSYMFSDCSSLQSLDLSGFVTSNVADMSHMFSGCGSLQTLDLSGFATSNVAHMPYMFYGCGSLQSLDLSGFDTSNVTDMSLMFFGCGSLQTLDLSGFDTSNVVNISYVFSGCSSLQSLDLSGFNTSNVADMSHMFSGCSSLQSLDVGGLDTSNVTNMGYMFSGCSSLQTLDLSGLDASNVTDMSHMFSGCSSLQTLDLNGFKTLKLRNIDFLFSDCDSLQQLDLSSFEITSGQSIFPPKLLVFWAPINVIVRVELPDIFVDDFGTEYNILPKRLSESIRLTRKVKPKDIAYATVTGIENKTYTGTAQIQKLSVKLEEYTLMEGTDYTLSYTNNTNVGTAAVLITGKGNYTGTFIKFFTINAASIADATVTGITNKTYTGTAQTQNPTVKLGDTTLTAGTDYTLSYADNIDAGTATVTITGKGNYTGTISQTFSINAVSITSATVTGITNKTYTGIAQTQNPTVKLGDKTLTAGTDYTLSYADNTNAGTATVTITGKGIYTGTISKTFTINAASISGATVTGITNKTYTGTGQTQNPTVKLSDKTLTAGTDYTLSYADNTNAGTATVTITGKGNYTGTISKTFTISAASITSATVTGITNKTYTGTAQTQNPTVKLGEKTLTVGTDYTLSYLNNTNIGTATVTITGKGNYTETVSKTFTISAASISDATVTGIKDKTYTGKAQTQNPTVKLGEKTLTVGTDYTLSYSNNTNAGTATVTITGKGNYAGAVSKTFTISAASISSATVTGIANKTYTGTAQTQNPTVKVGDTTLTAGTDYTLSYADNTNAGTATVTITGKGIYTGTISKTFTISAASISDATVTGIKDKTYTGKAQTQNPTVKLGDVTLTKGIDYTLSYADNTNAGKATVTITGKGNYTGTINRTFTIIREDRSGLFFEDGEAHLYNQGVRITGSGTPVVNGAKYYVVNGVARTGWLHLGNWQMYFDPETYEAAKGFTEIDGKMYLFNDDGVMQSFAGTPVINGNKYWFSTDNGSLRSGWLYLLNWKMYFDPSTYAAAVGFKEINGKTYLFNKDGVMQNYAGTTIINVNGKNNKYWFSTDDASLKTGWLILGNMKLYFDPKTYAAYTNGTYTIDGKKYTFNADGVAI